MSKAVTVSKLQNEKKERTKPSKQFLTIPHINKMSLHILTSFNLFSNLKIVSITYQEKNYDRTFKLFKMWFVLEIVYKNKDNAVNIISYQIFTIKITFNKHCGIMMDCKTHLI